VAGLVKLLRKAVRDMGGRASTFLDACLKMEKEQAKQVCLYILLVAGASDCVIAALHVSSCACVV
jgi:hypothetical protein